MFRAKEPDERPVKKEQEMKAAERRKVIDQRCGKQVSREGMNEGKMIFRHSAFCKRASVR